MITSFTIYYTLQAILKEIDDEFTEEELDEIIADVRTEIDKYDLSNDY